MKASNEYSSEHSNDADFTPSNFRPIPFILIILVIMLIISQSIKWYSTAVTLPRFCQDPESALHHLSDIIYKKSPITAEQSASTISEQKTGHKTAQKSAQKSAREIRRPYIIAAKLIYLIPQHSNESDADYLHRVRQELSQRCVR